ncbi:MAG: winged helix-turn-helix domain-containing protein [Candidatus Aenigmarchaeota archaeon]|nr:winged helix-turn-helix domain-containing protein [Candidatus Aenigmarchaeota archaeon]
MEEVIDKPTLKALGTQTRQEILKHLAKRPYTSSELSKLLNKHVTTITEHMEILEKSNVVKRNESTNKWVYYSLTQKGEKFFKPYYTWIITLGIATVAFIIGAYETLFVEFRSSNFAVQEAKAVAGTAPLAETTVVYDTNLIIGVALIIIAAALFFYVTRKRSKIKKEKNKIMEELEKAHNYR